MKYTELIIEAAANDIRAKVTTPSEILKRRLRKQRILKLAGKTTAPRSKGEPNIISRVISPQETLKRAKQKNSIRKMCK